MYNLELSMALLANNSGIYVLQVESEDSPPSTRPSGPVRDHVGAVQNLIISTVHPLDHISASLSLLLPP
jgi:hypothetical protein